MGWTGLYSWNAPKGHADTKAYLIQQNTFTNANGSRSEIVAISNVGSVWYLAVRVTPNEPMEYQCHEMADGSYVYGLVYLTQRRNGEFLYKDLAETAGPCESRAPMKIINLLSKLEPTEKSKQSAEFAQSWRDRCIANATRKTKLVEGMKIRLEAPVTFNDGVAEQEFIITSYQRRGQTRRAYTRATTGGMVRLLARHLDTATVVA